MKQENKAEQIMRDLLQEFVGCTDVALLDFKNIDETLTKDKLNLNKVRGSIRLMTGRVKTPADVAAYRDKVLKMELP